MSRRLTELLDPRDTVARLGGDEFAVLLRSARSADRGHGRRRPRSAARWPSRSTPRASASSSAAASASRSTPRTATTSRRSCSAPTSRCTRPRRARPASSATRVAAGRLEPRPPRARGRPAPRAREERVRPLLPAEDRPARPAAVVGAEALLRWNHPTQASVVTRRLHPARRADRPDRAGHAAGDLGRDPRVQPLARPRPWRPVRRGEPLRPRPRRPAAPGPRRGAVPLLGPADPRARARDHREHDRRRPGPHAADRRAPRRPRRPPVDRRLRHRLLVARVPQGAAGRAR